jgi:hypothetical protein
MLAPPTDSTTPLPRTATLVSTRKDCIALLSFDAPSDLNDHRKLASITPLEFQCARACRENTVDTLSSVKLHPDCISISKRKSREMVHVIWLLCILLRNVAIGADSGTLHEPLGMDLARKFENESSLVPRHHLTQRPTPRHDSVQVPPITCACPAQQPFCTSSSASDQ